MNPSDRSSLPADPGSALVVDDDAGVRDFYAEVLTGMGFRVDTAADGVEGLERVRSMSYTLIISDVRMPRMPGHEFLVKAEEVRPGVGERFIFTTGHVDNLSTLEYMAVSEKTCILKPATPEVIEQAVLGLLRQ